MLAGLPALSFVLGILYFGATNGKRAAFIKASVAWGLLVAASTEILSLLNALFPATLAAFWAIASVVIVIAGWRRRGALAERFREIKTVPLSWTRVAAAALLVFVFAGTGVIAWVAPPNTYDSMAYHMARVAHWAADGTVADYPTNILRQLYSSPWAEFAVLHLQLLSGGDRLANLVQWVSMVGSVAGASLIARQLGSPPRGQLLAAFFVATLPMGILQASSTQTDYVLAFWLVCTVFLVLDFVSAPTLGGAAWCASALGLAMLTKGTAYVFAAPLVLAFGVWMVTRLRGRLALALLLMALIPLAINFGYFERNQTLFDNPLAPASDTAQLVNATHSPQAIVSNVIRDGILQFGTPSTTVNGLLDRGISRLHSSVLHIGVNDPRTTFPDAIFHVNPLSLDEDYAGDPIQALLAIGAILLTLGLAWRRAPPSALVIYAGGLVLAYLIFAAYLRWQPWHSRLELPLLVLSAPVVAVVFAKRVGARAVAILAAAMFIAAAPWVVDNQTRPLVGFALPTQPRLLPNGETIFNTPRTDLYFAKQQALEAIYVSVVARADHLGCHEIGFLSGPADWEYPLWVLAGPSGAGARIDSVLVHNESAHAANFASKPCMVVAVSPGQSANLTIGGVQFRQLWSTAGVAVYEPSAVTG